MTLADQGFLEFGSKMRLEYRMVGPRPETAPTTVSAGDATMKE